MVRFLLAGVPILAATLVLLGWYLDLPVLERLATPFVTMNPATAIGIAMAGLSLVLINCSNLVRAAGLRRLLRGAALTLCAGVLCGAVLKLSDVAAHTRFLIDARLFSQEMAKASGPNRMSPNAAADFVLMSCAILLASRRSVLAVITSQVCCIVGGLVAFLALVGYVFGVTPLYGIGSFTPMALHTALCMVLLFFEVLGLREHDGLMTCITNAGPAGRMSRLLLPASVATPIIVGALRLAGLRAHLYSVEFSISLSVVLTVAMMVVLTWIGAHWLFAEDLKRRQIEAELMHRASHDRLTGLANRTVFFERLQQRLDLMHRRSAPAFAVFYLDVDGFKQINDRLGHEAGDQFLVQTANILLACTRKTDLVARLGGDEFTIMFAEIEPASDVNALADRILQAFPTRMGPAHGFRVGLSIGIAIGGADDRLPEDVLRHADLALYEAKTSGKGRYRIYAATPSAPAPPVAAKGAFFQGALAQF